MALLPFLDRAAAGRQLGTELIRHKIPNDAIVLALPRGGVVVGRAVADILRASLDIVVIRKLGVPWQPELAMGAIAGTVRILDEELIREAGISLAEIEAVTARERAEMERRERLYRAGRAARDLGGRTVLLVEDGLATGSTMTVAVRHVRSLEPNRVIIAVPVASLAACEWLTTQVDSCVCLATPEPFRAVGEWYVDFRQVTDVQVQDLLAA